MSAPAPIPHHVLEVQRQASDPSVSAWVAANAGSGKTHVLAQRVIRLLLEGTDPGKILCLTFTKAAAANMANRVFTTLAKWTTLDDAALDKAIRDVGARSDAARRAAARRLFASALETPGGLKIQTIHGFCARLLQQFPFEAHVAARFRVLEETQQRQLLERLRLAVLIEAAAQPDCPLGRALADATTAASDFAFKDALDEAIRKRDEVVAFVDGAGGIDGVRKQLSQALDVDVAATLEAIERDIIEGPFLPIAQWSAAADAWATGSSSDQDQAERLREALAAAGSERVDAYLSVFITDKGPRKSVITAASRNKHPDLARRLAQEQERITRLDAQRRGAAIRDRTAALVTLAVEIIARYRAEKDRAGLLDYDDLIDKTGALLERVEAAWVHYKLDLGIDHLLVDEAQDTSAAQWDIVRKLVSEFTVGIGARGALERSIFAVGDEKQSIFSFQGAVLEVFAEMGRQFGRAHAGASLPFLPLEFKHSFRSLQVVLDAVDVVFAQPQAFSGLSTDKAPTAHTAVRAHGPGFVEIWDLVEPDDKPDVEAWDAPFDTASETNPRAKLARTIAGSIRTWIARGDVVGGDADRHPVRPGDILILVRQRGPLFEAIIRALKDAGIPVAGADRLILTEHIAVMDLLVLADAILLEQDDLALATVLKSPLFGLSETDLFDLVWNRRGTLRAVLRERRPEIARELDALSTEARSQTPFEFYARLLGAGGARRRFITRLGAETNDALDEFLNLALDYESRETPSLQGFIAWMRTASADIKRDMEIARDEVRVMTVHGAKGLEAPIVILADTTTAPMGPPQYQPRLLALPRSDAPADTPACLTWMPNRKDEVPPVARARAEVTTATENEYRRLLYVAMTRAADRLVVCGALGKQAMPTGCWYQLVREGLEASDLLVEEPADHGDGTVLRFRTAPRQPMPPAERDTKQMSLALAPAWLTTSLPGEPAFNPTLTPSGADPRHVADARATGRGSARRDALLRGVLVHRLLQSLPDIPAQRRPDLARQFLLRAGRDLAAAHDELIAQVERVLDDARFKPLFAPGSRAEVPIVGRLILPAGPQLVSGQIDRLAITPDAVLIADYKTDRPAPRGVEQVARGYLRQLALYRALLLRIYPGRVVRAALVWTDIPDLMELSRELLDREIASLTCL
jgi:ATP-dependent helicase/nuclease subunit A